MDVPELRARMAALPPISGDVDTRFTWPFRMRSIRDAVSRGDPAKFLRWSVSEEFLHSGDTPQVREVMRELNFHGCGDQDVLRDVGFGSPQKFMGTSGTYLLQRYYAFLMDDFRGVNSIVEIGGGYGVMAVMARRLGYTGPYKIIDLPEMLLIQEYYISNVLGNTDKIHFGTSGSGNVDLMISICSLSEIPDIQMRHNITRPYSPRTLFAVYQPVWNGVDNVKYFSAQVEFHDEHRWRTPGQLRARGHGGKTVGFEHYYIVLERDVLKGGADESQDATAP